MPVKKKSEIITFKVDETILKAMRGISNRSDFIREAVMTALDSTCPLCRGTGTLSPNQRHHWERFCENHALQECGECHELHLVCGQSSSMDGSHDKEI